MEDFTMEMKMDIYQKAAQFLINVKTNEPRELICHSLVLSILADSSNSFSVNRTVREIESKWKIRVPPERVSRSLKKLAIENNISKNENTYFMDEQQKEKYYQNIKIRLSFFKEVENDWIENMQRSGSCRPLKEDEKELVIKDFRYVMDAICDRHVQKVINFLNNKAMDMQNTFIGKELIECIPPSDTRTEDILNIEKTIFPLFFQNTDTRRSQYCAGLAQTYLRRTIFEVETQGKNIFEKKLNSVNLFLDTNLIFNLLGLHGDEEKETTERLIGLNRSVGVNVIVDKRSIQEFRSVLNNSRKNNIGPRIPREIFSEVKKAIKIPTYKPSIEFALPEDSFALAFWASLDDDAKDIPRKTAIARWDAFLNYLDSVEIILSEKYKIKTVNECSKTPFEQTELEEAVESILGAARRHRASKTRSTAEHDAIVFFTIKRLREDENPTLLPSNTWLLTADSTLKDFHKSMSKVKDNGNGLTYFLTVTPWTELIMPFLNIQLVDEKENAIAIARSLGEGFSYYAVDRIPPRDVAEILRRIPEANEKGPELVLRCATNRFFKDTVHGVLSGNIAPTPQMIDEAVIKAFEGVEEKALLADKNTLAEIAEVKKQIYQYQTELQSEKLAREKAEAKIARWNAWIKLLRSLLLLTAISAATAYVGYFLIEPNFKPFTIESGLWIFGCIALIGWEYFSIKTKNPTLRVLILVFLIIPIIFIAGLFIKYWGDSTGIGILGAVLAIVMGILVALIKSSWLDLRLAIKQ
jgi:hypothetical protein